TAWDTRSANEYQGRLPARFVPKWLGICYSDRQDRSAAAQWRQSLQVLSTDRREERVAPYVLAIDQGTTSTRAMLFRADTSVAAVAQREFPQHFPADGEVEHEPEDLWTTTLETCRSAMRDAGARAADIAAIGIANQRETALLWDRTTGR